MLLKAFFLHHLMRVIIIILLQFWILASIHFWKFRFLIINFAGFYHLFLSFVTDCSFQCKRTKYPDDGQRGAPDEGWMGPRSSSEQASKQARVSSSALFSLICFYGGRVLAVSRGCWRRTCRALANHSWSAARPSPIVLIDVRLAIGEECAADRSSVGRGPANLSPAASTYGEHWTATTAAGGAGARSTSPPILPFMCVCLCVLWCVLCRLE